MKKLPADEKHRREVVRGAIACAERDIKMCWREFKRNVKGELIGSPRYEDAFRHAQDATRLMKQHIAMLERELPPHLIWRAAGYLERMPVFSNGQTQETT